MQPILIRKTRRYLRARNIIGTKGKYFFDSALIAMEVRTVVLKDQRILKTKRIKEPLVSDLLSEKMAWSPLSKGYVVLLSRTMVTWMESWIISSMCNSFLLNVRRANLVSSKNSETNSYSFVSEALRSFTN